MFNEMSYKATGSTLTSFLRPQLEVVELNYIMLPNKNVKDYQNVKLPSVYDQCIKLS